MNAPSAGKAGRKPASERRAEILDAAAVQFAETGFAGTSLESIAARVEVSHPRVVQMFGSKRALFLETLSTAYDRICAEFDAAAVANGSGPVPLIVLGAAYRRLLVRDRTVALVILQGYAAGDEAVRGEAARHHKAIVTKIAALSGADEFGVRTFIATGLVVTVSTALGLPGQRKDEAWAVHVLSS